MKNISGKVTAVSLETAFRNFHQLSIRKLPTIIMGEPINFNNLQLPAVKTVLVQSVNRQILNTLLVRLKTATSQSPSRSTVPVLLSEEENAIRYASGYVAMNLKKTFEKQDSNKAAQFVDCLAHMAIEGE